MSDNVLKYPKGSVMVFTTGSYSDYGIRGFLVAIQDCDLPRLAQEMANGKDAYMDDDARPDNFPSWLVAKGYALPIDHSEVHLGEYSDWANGFGVKLLEE